MQFSPDSYSKQKSELEQKKQQALVEQNTTEVENLEQQLLKLEEQKAQFEQLSSTEIPQHQQDRITELGGDTTITGAVDHKINEVTQETVEKVAEVTKPLSALEKARLLKEQKAQEKLEAEQRAHQQELQSAEQAEASYTQLQQQLEDLETQKKELQEKIDAQKQIRKEKIDSQRSALRELHSDEETKELLKDADTKQEIFGDDQIALDEAKKTQRTLEGSLNELQGKLDETTQLKETAYQQTAEGKERVKQEQEKAKIFEKVKTFKDIKECSNLEEYRVYAEIKKGEIDTLREQKKQKRREYVQSYLGDPEFALALKNKIQETLDIFSDKEDLKSVEEIFENFKTNLSTKESISKTGYSDISLGDVFDNKENQALGYKLYSAYYIPYEEKYLQLDNKIDNISKEIADYPLFEFNQQFLEAPYYKEHPKSEMVKNFILAQVPGTYYDHLRDTPDYRFASRQLEIFLKRDTQMYYFERWRDGNLKVRHNDESGRLRILQEKQSLSEEEFHQGIEQALNILMKEKGVVHWHVNDYKNFIEKSGLIGENKLFAYNAIINNLKHSWHEDVSIAKELEEYLKTIS